MWFNKNKETKEQKAERLNNELKDYVNTHCFDDKRFNSPKKSIDGIFIFMCVDVYENDVVYCFRTTTTLEGRMLTMPIHQFDANYIQKCRDNFKVLKAQFKHFGLTITQ